MLEEGIIELLWGGITCKCGKATRRSAISNVLCCLNINWVHLSQKVLPVFRLVLLYGFAILIFCSFVVALEECSPGLPIYPGERRVAPSKVDELSGPQGFRGDGGPFERSV